MSGGEWVKRADGGGMMLREFKARYLSRLLNLRKQLLEKYPEKRERVEYVIDILTNKLQTLRVYTLADYLHTVRLAVKEFPEFEVLVPTEEEVEELLRGGEK
jgi:hypothetical protein